MCGWKDSRSTHLKILKEEQKFVLSTVIILGNMKLQEIDLFVELRDKKLWVLNVV